MTLDSALDRLTDVLMDEWGREGTVDVYLWPDAAGRYGARITEIGYTRVQPGRVTGFSYMQDVPESAQVLFLAERYLLALLDDWSDEDVADQENTLRHAVREDA